MNRRRAQVRRTAAQRWFAGGRWAPFRAAVFNVGDVPVLTDVIALLEDELVDALVLLECLDRESLLTELVQRGYRLAWDTGSGRQACVVVTRPATTTLDAPWWAMGFAGGGVGPGAGPNRLPPKWVTVAPVRHHASGRRIHVGGTHLVASHQYPRRERIATAHVEAVVGAFRARAGVKMLGTDANHEPGARCLRALAGGWRCSHDVLGKTPTHFRHGPRAIDQLWVRRTRRVRWVSQRAIPTASDHHALVVELAIRVRPAIFRRRNR